MFQELRKKWLVMVDLFATSSNHRCSLYFSPFHDPQALGMDAFLHNWDCFLLYQFPPWALIPQVLRKLCVSSSIQMTLIAPYWLQQPWFSDFLDLVVDVPVALPSSPDLLRQPHFYRRHLGIHRLSLHAWRLSSDLPRAEGFSSRVAVQVGLARHRPSYNIYQLKWSVYRRWCCSESHSISRPSLPKVADFLFWLRRSKNLSISSILGYHPMLSAVFRFKLLGISSDPVLRDLIRSFMVEAPPRPVRPPSWDLTVVLQFLNSSTLEPLHLCSVRNLTKKVSFLVSLATAKHVGELQAISRCVLCWSGRLPLIRSGVCGQGLLPTLRLVWMMTSCCALSGLSGSTFVGLVPSLLLHVGSSCLLGFPLILSRRMVFLSSYRRSSMSRELLGWKAV